MHDEIYMLWLSTLVSHMGSRKLNTLLSVFGSARNIFIASTCDLKIQGKLTDQALSRITKDRSFDYIENTLRDMESKQMTYISRNHERFPALLAAIPDPPVGIFCVGELPADNTQKAAIIGSRRCTEYGRTATGLLAKPLAENGIVIVSGMARGIDSIAHRGAIEGGGKTIAVLGCGLDICYPPENRDLRDKIAKNGCVISEYPPGVPPHARHFPARNRIISGLSHLLIVVEAAKRSGTLITVDQALDQGRSVMAVPGNITNKYSQGTNNLIKQGAEPVCSTEDILEVLGLDGLAVQTSLDDSTEKNFGRISGKSLGKIAAEPLPSIAPEEKLVYDVLDLVPQSLEDIVMKANSEVHVIQYLLTMLELKGLIRKLPGARYEKV